MIEILAGDSRDTPEFSADQCVKFVCGVFGKLRYDDGKPQLPAANRGPVVR